MMALMYPWATKEYLLWEMTIGQILYYHNMGLEIKYGIKSESASDGLLNKDVDELRKIRDEVNEIFEAEKIAKEELQRKYGDI